MNRYLILCCVGAGGNFLTTVIAQALGLDLRSQFSSTGHAHDLGQGVWKGSTDRRVCIIGDHWQLNYRPNCLLYYSHDLDSDFQSQNPDVELIYVSAEQQDYAKITELYVNKAFPDLWTRQEYDKWASDQYPPYSRNNIAESELIRNDLINDLQESVVAKWYQKYDSYKIDHEIKFKTVMGISDVNLAQQISQIVNMPVTAKTQQYIAQYQALNQSLYFQGFVK